MVEHDIPKADCILLDLDSQAISLRTPLEVFPFAREVRSICDFAPTMEFPQPIYWPRSMKRNLLISSISSAKKNLAVELLAPLWSVVAAILFAQRRLGGLGASLCSSGRVHGRIDSATRTFQALSHRGQQRT